MGPKTKLAIERRWEADSKFQKYCLEELRSQRGVQLAILAEIRKLSSLLERSLGDAHSAIETMRGDLDVLQKQSQEHERKLAAR